MATSNRPRVEQIGHPGGPSNHGLETKARKACINCRRQKMKCIAGDGNTCRRCHRAGVQCIFVRRANAANVPEVLLSEAVDGPFKADVLQRLQAIERCLGLVANEASAEREVSDEGIDGDENDDDLPENSGLDALWEASAVLDRNLPQSVPQAIWHKRTVKHLWSSFHERMPGLHFMQRKQTFSAPQPVLLASILYCSSTRGSPEMSALAPHYFTVLCNAIAQLSIPFSEIGTPPEKAEEWAFQTILGIVIAGLLTEAYVGPTGIWISIAYRLILEHCPANLNETSREWQKLFSGVQIVDLEHASLHLSCPVIPIESPLPVLKYSCRDQLYRLSCMMHTGLTHFTGRGLPTIWSCFTQKTLASNSLSGKLTSVDAAVIRDWARQLDEWLSEFSTASGGSEEDRGLVFRQYILHRLVVLSIYHPVSGINLWSNSITLQEQYELLLSARATLRLHLMDDSIWSNWDLVIITWAALIVIQGVERGVGEPDDMNNIQVHLEMLRQITEPTPGLCTILISRLEESLQQVHSPEFAQIQPNEQHNLDNSWQLFDQASLQHMVYSADSATGQVPPRA